MYTYSNKRTDSINYEIQKTQSGNPEIGNILGSLNMLKYVQRDITFIVEDNGNHGNCLFIDSPTGHDEDNEEEVDQCKYM